MYTNRTKSNKTKPLFRCLLHHLDRKQIGPFLQLLGLHGSLGTTKHYSLEIRTLTLSVPHFLIVANMPTKACSAILV